MAALPAEFPVKQVVHRDSYIVSVERGNALGCSYIYNVTLVRDGRRSCEKILLDKKEELVPALQHDLRLPRDCVERAGFTGAEDVHFRRVIGEPPPKKCKAAQEVEILLQHCGNGGTVWVSVMPFHTTMARALAAHQEDAVGPGGGFAPLPGRVREGAEALRNRGARLAQRS